MAVKYEFRLFESTRDTKDDTLVELNNLGKDGWEIVHVEENRSGGYRAWLQREAKK